MIEGVKDYFDCVLIIRGGGGDIGLSCYNDYMLCHKIATFPLPVLTGIGHSTNETVAEMISYANFITPTALADFILDRFFGFLADMDNIKKQIVRTSKHVLDKQNIQLQHIKQMLILSSQRRIEKEQYLLENDLKIIEMLNPLSVLKRGYSITTLDGKVIKSLSQVSKGERITTKVLDGEFVSKVE